VEYAESDGCRWQRLLGYFGGEGLPNKRCGHCDSCEQRASLQRARAGAKE
jgi:hypothetical protein